MKKTKKLLVGLLCILSVGFSTLALGACEEEVSNNSTQSSSSSPQSTENESSSSGEETPETPETPQTPPQTPPEETPPQTPPEEVHGSMGLEYTLSEDETYYIVTDIGECTDTDIIIPSEYKGKPVKSIGEEAFYACDNLIRVEIPDTVTNIESRAFGACDKIIEVYNKSAVDIIVGFWGSAHIGEYVRNIYTPISGQSKLSTDSNGYIIYTDGEDKILMGYKGADTDLILPSSITEIYQYAFYDCDSLISVEISDSVTSIGRAAFYDCDSLTSIEIPSGMNHIENDTFYDCDNLTSVEIPNSVTSIGGYAFYDCNNLTGVYITDIIAWCTIDFGAFSNPLRYARNLYLNNALLTELIITDGVTSIKDYAFFNCTSLTSVKIFDEVTSIGDCAFAYCTELTSVAIPNGVISIGDSAFYWCCRLRSIELPESVTSIGNEAFSFSDLISIVIDDNVTSIGEGAFHRCDNLTSVYYKGTTEQWNSINIDNWLNDDLTSATRYYYIENEADVPTDGGNYWHYDTDGKTVLIW